MIAPSNCPYKDLSAKPCWNCPHHIADTDECKLNYLAFSTVNHTNVNAYCAPSYEERLKQYEEDRAKMLQLSKEALVDLILHRPEMY